MFKVFLKSNVLYWSFLFFSFTSDISFGKAFSLFYFSLTFYLIHSSFWLPVWFLFAIWILFHLDKYFLFQTVPNISTYKCWSTIFFCILFLTLKLNVFHVCFLLKWNFNFSLSSVNLYFNNLLALPPAYHHRTKQSKTQMGPSLVNYDLNNFLFNVSLLWCNLLYTQ